MRASLRWVGRCLFIAVVVAWAVFLRPQWLGGPAAYVLVRGDSMVPTYQNGDLLLAYAKPSYVVGDIVAYRLPSGEVGAGHVVVHRIVALTADGGFSIQGDNNPTYDPWTVHTSDIVGSVVVRAAGVGTWLEMGLSPTIAGGLAAAIVVMVLVARMPLSGAASGAPMRPRALRRTRAARADS